MLMPRTVIVSADGQCWPNPGPGAFGVVVKSLDGDVLHAFRKDLPGTVTNNVAEWEACLAALMFLRNDQQGVRVAELRMDSQLIIYQLTGKYRCNQPHLLPLVDKGKALLVELSKRGLAVRPSWVPREDNADADAVADPLQGPAITRSKL